VTPEEFLQQDPRALRLYARVIQAMRGLDGVEVRVSKSQIALRRQKNFALVWRPGQYLHGSVAPLVLSVLMPRRIRSARWKEVVEPAPGRFTHHLELFRVGDVDAQVRAWLRAAWETAA